MATDREPLSVYFDPAEQKTSATVRFATEPAVAPYRFPSSGDGVEPYSPDQQQNPVEMVIPVQPVIDTQPSLPPSNPVDAQLMGPFGTSLRQENPHTHQQLTNKLSAAGRTSQTDCQNQTLTMASGMSFDDLLRNLVMDGEEIITPPDKHIMFTQVTFDGVEKEAESRNFGEGRALLTSKRLLLLSSGYQKATWIEKSWSLLYNVTSTSGDRAFYLPIPLRCVQSIQMVSDTSARSIVRVSGVPPCCGGCCFCLKCLCSCVVTNWLCGSPLRDHECLRYVRLGVLMPPWDTKTMLQLNLSPTFPLNVITEFLAEPARATAPYRRGGTQPYSPARQRNPAAVEMQSLVQPVINAQPSIYQPTGGVLDAQLMGPFGTGLRQEHPHTHEELTNTLSAAGTNTHTDCRNQTRTMACGMSFDDLLRRLVMDGEEIITPPDKHVMFTQVNLDDAEKKEDSRYFPGGRALFTSKRLLLLSSGYQQATWIEKSSSLKYNVTSTSGDQAFYLPIPLRCIRSIEMVSDTSARSTVQVNGVPACCEGYCFCFKNLCRCAVTNWLPRNPRRDWQCTRFVRLGVLMPPWDTKTILQLNLSPTFPLGVATEFLAGLQKYSQQLQ